jgi:lipopolysaccharide transport system ATP-binding protein
MSSSSIPLKDAAPAIEVVGLGKRYELFERPSDRLWHLLFGSRGAKARDFWALKDIHFEVRRGEVLGLIGRNGAGKSTLLQMVCGTLNPTEGQLTVNGRVAALLELGAGFNPEFTGLENVYLNGTLLGLSRRQIDERLDDILGFADIGDFVSQPVKTYSSGMFVRLAFAVATSVSPDILVIDEAMSVGDGAFARKSFDRVMGLRDAGTTILFCSHAMYHVHALCERAIWLEAGRIRMIDKATRVIAAYEASFGAEVSQQTSFSLSQVPAPKGSAAIRAIHARIDGLEAHFASDTSLPVPSVAVGIEHASGTVVASAISVNDGVSLTQDNHGYGRVIVQFPDLPLLKGDYSISVLLGCERGLHPYEVAERIIRLRVEQSGVEQGLVKLPRRWIPQ